MSEHPKEYMPGSPGWRKQQQEKANGADGKVVPFEKKGRGRGTPKTPKTPKPGSDAITLVKGRRGQAVDDALTVIRKRGSLYERGGELVRVMAGGVEPVADDWLLDYFDRHVNFYNEAHDLRDAPQWLGKRINVKKGERGLPELRAVITAPVMRDDGSLLDLPGYDEATGLLLVASEWPHVRRSPGREELRAAAATVWKPFVEFPFVDDAARGVMLAALLTSVSRQTLPLAPGFSFDAPAAGTGKTLLAFCLLALCGMDREAIPECRDEEELRKRLLAALRSGRPAVLLDNIRGVFGSAALEAALTTQIYSDRLLGGSRMLSLPTALLLLISGNNFRPAGDLWRRLLTCRIDAKTEAPERRAFKLEPFEHCRDNRQAIVAAALTLLRGFVSAGSPRATKDRIASFEAWDDRVRQAVIWIGRQGLMPDGASVADPVNVMERAKRAEPERVKLGALLMAAHSVMRDGRWRVADLIKAAEPAAGGHASCSEDVAALRAALEEIAVERGAINPRILGRWIERQADQHCAGLWLERAGTKWRAVLWQVKGIPEVDPEDDT
jgi:hypothetical protein